MHVAILDDDEAHNAIVSDIVRGAGHHCDVYSRPRSLLGELRRQTYDLLLIDWVMPEMTGIEVLRHLRESPITPPPVLLLTNRAQESDIVEALNAGADDYVIKPCAAPVLLARMAAVARRVYPGAAATGPTEIEGWSFDPTAETATRGGRVVALTGKEYSLALLLFQNISRALSREYLLQTVWGVRPDLETRTLDAHVSRLRTKMALRPAQGFRLVTIYGFGYRLERSEAGDQKGE